MACPKTTPLKTSDLSVIFRSLPARHRRFYLRGEAVYSRIMKPISFGRALYYPHIFPRDRRWLRTAALYHDGLARIVPRNFMPTEYDRHGSIDILHDFEALQESGFIDDEYPDQVLQDVGTQFLEFIAPSLENAERRSRLVSQIDSGEWRPYNMFRQKIDPSLLALLEEEGLVRSVNDYEVEFAGQVGGFYVIPREANGKATADC
jgi:hypothetical protein